MKMFKRTLALFMSACLFVSVFVSCSNEKPSGGETTATQTESVLPVSGSEVSVQSVDEKHTSDTDINLNPVTLTWENKDTVFNNDSDYLLTLSVDAFDDTERTLRLQSIMQGGRTVKIGTRPEYMLSYILTQTVSSDANSDFEYEIHENGKIELIKYLGNSTNIVIPDEIDGKPVSYIGRGMFKESSIESVEFGKNIIAVNSDSFSNCKQLSKVQLNDSLKIIGEGAFLSCEKLVEISIPKSVNYIGDYSFDGCNFSIASIPKNTNYVGDCAFSRTPLTKIEVENGAKGFQGGVFSANKVLESVYIPSSWNTNFGGAEFRNCQNLKKVEFAEVMDEPIIINAGMFEHNLKLKEIKLPQNVTEISQSAFEDCISLKEIKIPSSVKVIKDRAFLNCINLHDIYFESPNCDLSEACLGVLVKVHAPKGGTIEEYCKKQPNWIFVAS